MENSRPAYLIRIIPAEGFAKLWTINHPPNSGWFLYLWRKMDNPKAIIFVNGELVHPEKVRQFLQKNDYLIAVDGGLRHLIALDMKPDLVVGDLDSVTPEMLEFIESKKIPKLQLDIHKDETDLEIAIQTAYEMDYKDIFLVGAIGNRLDHTIENIFILTKPIWENINFTITDGTQDIFLIRSEKTFPGKINDVVSLIPLTNVVSKVSTKGLYYPLQNEDLFLDRARGVSNLMISNEVQIQIRSGILVCFHIYKEIN